MTKIQKYKYLLIAVFGLFCAFGIKAYAQSDTPAPLIITHNLSVGSHTQEVSWLQQFLKDHGFFTYSNVTGHFGQITRRAVVDFQKAYGISPTGNVGPITRAKIAELTKLITAFQPLPLPLPVPTSAIPSIINHISHHSGHPTPSYTLSVAQSGSGTGSVTDDPLEIDCGVVCSNAYLAGTHEILTATPSAGSIFAGWSGACTGTGTCELDITGDTTVTANFDAIYNLSVSKVGAGAGIVTSTPAGIDCGATCSRSFTSGTMVTLSASSASGSTFTGWSGACTGTGTCVVTMSNTKSVVASFAAALVSITVVPSNSRLPRNINEQFTATGHYADSSTADITTSVTWDTSDHTIATINGTGLGTGINAGATLVSATLDGVTGTTNLTVTNAVLVSIAITPSNPAVARDSTLQLSALGTFSDSSSADITNQANWSSSSNSIATVNDTDDKGNVTGVAGGASIISANLQSVTGTTTLHVGN